MVKRQERYINDIEDIRGVDKNKKQLRDVLTKFKSLQDKAAPRREYSQMLLGSLKNIYKEEKGYGNKSVSLKNIFPLFGVVTSFAFIVSAMFLFNQSRHVEQRDFIHFSQEGGQIESIEEAKFGKVLEEAQTDTGVYSADIGKEDAVDKGSDFEGNIQESVRNDDSLGTENLETKEPSPLLTKKEGEELSPDAKDQIPAPQMLRAKSVEEKGGEDEKVEEEVLKHQEDTPELMNDSELMNDVSAEFFMKRAPLLDGRIDTGVQSMMGDESLIQREQEFRDICLAHSGMVEASTMICVFDDGKSCNIENIFEDSLEPCEYLYGKDSVKIEKKSDPEIDINLQELMETFGQ